MSEIKLGDKLRINKDTDYNKGDHRNGVHHVTAMRKGDIVTVCYIPDEFNFYCLVTKYGNVLTLGYDYICCDFEVVL